MNAPTPLPALVERMDQRSPLALGGEARALIPTSFEGVWRMAEVMAKSGLAPKDLATPEKISVAIFHGLEVGLPPMQAVQSIAVINGRPSIWGDAALGLVRASGLLEKHHERIEGEGDNRVAICVVKRRGEDEKESRYSVSDAKTAKLWGKRGSSGQDTPWITHPERMLKMRARAFALRDNFTDILRGLGIREEMEDVSRTTGRAHSEPPPAPDNVIEGEFKEASASEPSAAVQDAGPAQPPAGPASDDLIDATSPEAILEECETVLAGAKTPEEVEQFYSEGDYEAWLSEVPNGVDQARDIKERHLKRVLIVPDSDIPPDFPDDAAYAAWINKLIEIGKGAEGARFLEKAWAVTKVQRSKLVSEEENERLRKLIVKTIRKLDPPKKRAEKPQEPPPAPAAVQQPPATEPPPAAESAMQKAMREELDSRPPSSQGHNLASVEEGARRRLDAANVDMEREASTPEEYEAQCRHKMATAQTGQEVMKWYLRTGEVRNKLQLTRAWWDDRLKRELMKRRDELDAQ